MLDGVKPVVDRVQDNILCGLRDAERVTFLRLLEKALDAVGDISRSDDRPPAPLRRAVK